jgi:hypothetical protein
MTDFMLTPAFQAQMNAIIERGLGVPPPPMPPPPPPVVVDRIFSETKPLFEKFCKTPNVEFEFRLGKSVNGGKSFDTNVGKATFDRILRRLKKYQGWQSCAQSVDTVYTSDSSIRLTIDANTDQQTQIRKQKLYKNDFAIPGRAFDVRFAVAVEEPISLQDVEYTRARQRTRHSFVRKNVRIDATVVTGDPNDMDSEEEAVYQVELEVIDPTKVDNFYNVVFKIQNLLDIV